MSARAQHARDGDGDREMYILLVCQFGAQLFVYLFIRLKLSSSHAPFEHRIRVLNQFF
jgi:hypothetical protein